MAIVTRDVSNEVGLGMKSRCAPAGRGSRALACCLGAVVSLACPPAADSVDRRLDAIRELQASERFQESIEPLGALLAEMPDAAEANHLLGVAFLRTGAPTLALWPLRRASEHESFAVESGLLLASALLDTGNPEQAIAVAGGVLARDPRNAPGHMLEARAHLQLRDLPAALEALDSFLEVAPDDLQGLWQRAAVLAALGRPEAVEAYEAVKGRAEAGRNTALVASSCVAMASLRLREDQPPAPRRPALGSMARASLGPVASVADPRERLVPSAAAEEALRRCVAESPTEAQAVGALAEYLAATAQLEPALEAWRAAIEGATESLPFRVGLANQLWVMGQRDEAKETLREATRLANGRSWEALAELQRLDGEFEAAATTLAEALERDPDRAELAFLRANLLVEAGRLDEAEPLVEKLEAPEYRELLRGRILLERGRPAEALQAFDAGLARWPNNAVARALAGRAAQEIGDLERALEEYRESVRSDARATDAGLAAARIAHVLGRYDEVVTYAGYQIRSHPYQGIEPYRIAVVAAQAAGMQDAVADLLGALERQKKSAEATILRAELARRVGGAAAEVAVLDESGLDLTAAENEPVLHALARARVAGGRSREALAVVDRALETRPKSPDLHDVRGRLLLELGRDAEARGAFERGLTLDASHPGALAGLGALAFRGGDAQQALAWFERSLEADPNDAEVAYRAAQLAAQLGRPAEAVQRLRALLVRDPGHAEAAQHLAWLLAQGGEDLDLALALAERAANLEPAPHVLDTLAFVQLRRGEHDSATRTLEGALAAHPRDGTLRYRLGTVLLARGETEAARRALEEALAMGSFPEADAARGILAEVESR